MYALLSFNLLYLATGKECFESRDRLVLEKVCRIDFGTLFVIYMQK